VLIVASHLSNLLGLKSEKKVYKYLLSNNIKGQRGQHCDCPIANALKQDGFKLVRVDGRYITGYRYDDHYELGIMTPVHIRNFIGHFDSGKYSDLSDEPLCAAGDTV